MAPVDDPNRTQSAAETDGTCPDAGPWSANESSPTEWIEAGQQLDTMERLLRRISYDLHDGPVQTLSAALLELQLSTKHPFGGADRAENVRQMIEGALSEIREIGSTLHPRALEATGLRGMIEALLAEKSRRHPWVRLELRDELGDGELELSPSAQIALFRIVQESINNALKHAGAANIIVDLGKTDSRVACTITDDGCGFAQAEEAMQARRSHGLTYMQDRARLLGGKLGLSSSPGAGTVVSVSLPVWQ